GWSRSEERRARRVDRLVELRAGRLGEGEHGVRCAAGERGGDVVAGHESLAGDGEPVRLHAAAEVARRAPSRAAVERGDEPDVEVAGVGVTGGVRDVVVGEPEVSAAARGRAVDTQPGYEVVGGAG